MTTEERAVYQELGKIKQPLDKFHGAVQRIVERDKRIEKLESENEDLKRDVSNLEAGINAQDEALTADINKHVGTIRILQSQLAEAQEQAAKLESALQNVRILAARELRREQVTPERNERNAEMWGHVLRFCREAGVEPSILRDATTEEACQSK